MQLRSFQWWACSLQEWKQWKPAMRVDTAAETNLSIFYCALCHVKSSSFQLCSERGEVSWLEASRCRCAVLLPEGGTSVAWMGKQLSPGPHSSASGVASERAEGTWSQLGQISIRFMWHTSLSRGGAAVLWGIINLWEWDIRAVMLVADAFWFLLYLRISRPKRGKAS